MYLTLLLFVSVIAVVLALKWRSAVRLAGEIKAASEKTKFDDEQRINQLLRDHSAIVRQLQQELSDLAPFRDLKDAVTAARAVVEEAEHLRSQAGLEVRLMHEAVNAKVAEILDYGRFQAEEIRQLANLDYKKKMAQVDAILAGATRQAEQVLRDAGARADEIAGDAYRALKEADRIQAVAAAMRNVIEGYGDRYLKPTYSLLDELAEAYGFEEAGQQLKAARDRTKLMVEHKGAATCEYVEANRRDTATRFVEDAFNGKVDSILSRVKADNYGTLEQQIRDAFALVNNNGAAFRNARITDAYLGARLDELKVAVLVHALRERDKEEQRRIREQIREEEKARREIERALKETAREEDLLQKAMEKVQSQVAKANEEQRAALEAKLRDLQDQLAEAAARGQRALSMAQQTKAGHVYVISNMGSFGEDVFKVGMTRRLEPLDRVRELGDASVPFSFDVHAMIWCENAPQLESQLHKLFVRSQINKVNPRKEFFRVPLADLRSQIDGMGIQAQWTMASDAAEYRESLAIERRLAENPAAAGDWLDHQLAAADVQELVQDLEEN